jgi:hypothetical protein
MSAMGAADRSGGPGVRSLPPAALEPASPGHGSLAPGSLEPGGLELVTPDPDAGWCTDGVCLPPA